jgi:hypothetical protein
MAIFVLTDASVTVNTVDLSTYCQSVTVNYAKDSIETTAMGATGHVFTGGLQNNSITLELQNDEAVGKTMETLFSAVGSGANTLVVKNTTSGATFTASNMFLESSTPVVGSVGDLAVQSVTFTGGSIVKT